MFSERCFLIRRTGSEVVVSLTIHKPVVDCVMKGTPPDYGSFTEAGGVRPFTRSLFDHATALNLTIEVLLLFEMFSVVWALLCLNVYYSVEFLMRG